MSTYVYSLELQHHGIKGMKWGIRRFQRKDGSLTPAGKKRYDDDASQPREKSTHRSRLEAKYRQNGMTAKQAAAAADKHIKTEKTIALVAGLTVAAAAAYVVNKNVKERADGIIKSGTKMQVISNLNKVQNRESMEKLAKEGAAYVGVMAGATFAGNKLTKTNDVKKTVKKR